MTATVGKTPSQRHHQHAHVDVDVTTAIVWSPQVSRIHDVLPSNPGRSTLVHTLLRSLGLLSTAQFPHLRVISPLPAEPRDLLRVHDPRYLHVIGQLAKGAPVSDVQLAQAGLVHDSPPFRGLAAHVRLAAGGSLQAAAFLTSPNPLGVPRVAMHWDGGRHHARSASAAGFCYVNDIALAVDHFLTHSPADRPHPVVYLDLDVHHGDGVEHLFCADTRVVTVSVHHYDPRGGYYPGTGAAEDAADVHALFDATNDGNPGQSRTKSWINVPLDHGCSDTTLIWVVSRVLGRMHQGGLTRPRAVVVQCGADGLAGDPKGRVWNLSEQAFVRVLREVRRVWGGASPVLVLGGGGYAHANTARAWAAVTAAAVRMWDPAWVDEACGGLDGLVPDTIPLVQGEDAEEANGLLEEAFGPLFEMAVQTKRGMRDCNVVDDSGSGKVKGSIVRALDRAVDAVLNTCVTNTLA